MKKLISIIFVLLSISFAASTNAEKTSNLSIPPAIQNVLQKSKPLSGKELRELVVNSTMIGHTCTTHSVYELFFKADGTVIFRKSLDNHQVHKGKWWISNNHIYSQWKTYQKKPSINELDYYHLAGDTYIPYNIKDACGPAGTFGQPFLVIKGDQAGLGSQ